ncbi:phosphotransferase [Zhihengliuella salsuginis]|uniref:Phosphotransferase enzyme family protein n=1 Tax=Zhihengliuella salsuginis TaxID=578222 RepID=A0ABQ3GJ44_9MICC|nr:phosphotransferase [Zhihengliuella salsuginis]GHD10080.1 hypothetical protein GCM10008096_23240 [Zhihengliuella salsuginis]
MSAQDPPRPALLPAAGVLFAAADGGSDALDGLARRLGPVHGRVRADHLRYKPGRSVIGRLNDSDGTPIGWVSGYGPAAADKAARLLRTGAKAGVELPVFELGDGHVLIAGPIGADKRLGRLMRRTGSVRADRSVRGGVLNYNPGRRLVVRRRDLPASGAGPGGDVVVKLSRRPYGHVAPLAAALKAGGVPALEPHPLAGHEEHALAYEYYGTGNLAAGGAGAEFEQAGGLLRAWHASGARVEAATSLPRLDATARMGAVVAGVEGILPGAGGAARRAAERLGEALAEAGGDVVPLHGDYSPDQLLRGARGLRVIDADRAAWGHPGWDLGCFAAADLLAGEAGSAPGLDTAAALLRGYGGARHLPAFAGAHVLLRALEPFRAADPDWVPRVSRRLALAERLAAAPPDGGVAAVRDALRAVTPLPEGTP